VFCPDTFARAQAGVLMYRKYIPRVPPAPGLGLGANHPIFSYVEPAFVRFAFARFAFVRFAFVSLVLVSLDCFLGWVIFYA
jgi:hypothetical protein